VDGRDRLGHDAARAALQINASLPAGLELGGVDAIFLECFRAKWVPVRVKKTRQNKNLELRF
jgi:hypothetical protein